MRASWLTQFFFVTPNAFCTVWFVVVNRDFLETKLKFINQPSVINKLYLPHRSDEGQTLETSAFLLFTVANLRFQPSC